MKNLMILALSAAFFAPSAFAFEKSCGGAAMDAAVAELKTELQNEGLPPPFVRWTETQKLKKLSDDRVSIYKIGVVWVKKNKPYAESKFIVSTHLDENSDDCVVEKVRSLGTK